MFTRRENLIVAVGLLLLSGYYDFGPVSMVINESPNKQLFQGIVGSIGFSIIGYFL